jgi:radical S-adenosyl methionine domain-containing protein 2
VSLYQIPGLDSRELHEVERARGAPYGYSPDEANLPYVLPKLALLLAVMRKFQLNSVEFHQTHGNSAGVLVDPTLWSDPMSDNQDDLTPQLKLRDDREGMLLTFNWHLEKTCNYKCKFCYAHFADQSTVNLDESTGIRLLDAMAQWGVYKVNFAGGEPLLNQHLGTYLKHATKIGLKTSIITNASRMTWSWLQMHAPYINQIGISCDSVHEAINKSLGRGGGSHVAITERAFKRLHEVNEHLSLNIKLKLNTVVTKKSLTDDWTDFIRKNGVERWKVFKVLKIEGENDDSFDELEVTDAEFEEFKARHAEVAEVMVTENNDEMTSSYIMTTPDGRFFQNTDGRYSKSQPILDVGVQTALEEVGFNFEQFCRRGGAYSL